MNSNKEEKPSYYITLKEWNQDQMKIQLNFKEPLKISQGFRLDQCVIKIKNPEYFVSLQSGEMIKKEHSF